MADMLRLLAEEGLLVRDERKVFRGEWQVGWAYEKAFDEDDPELSRFTAVFDVRPLSDGSAEQTARTMFERAKKAGYPALLLGDDDEKLDQFEPSPSSAA
jgi:hypothetical protein